MQQDFQKSAEDELMRVTICPHKKKTILQSGKNANMFVGSYTGIYVIAGILNLNPALRLGGIFMASSCQGILVRAFAEEDIWCRRVTTRRRISQVDRFHQVSSRLEGVVYFLSFKQAIYLS